MLAPPHLVGLATYYDDRHGVLMRNGERLDLAAATVAVDAGEWQRLRSRQLVVLTECGRWALVRVTDSGMLHDAGRFAWAVGPLGVARYWPVDTLELSGIKYGDSYRMVLDFPAEFYEARINCDDLNNGGIETTKVLAWEIVE